MTDPQRTLNTLIALIPEDNLAKLLEIPKTSLRKLATNKQRTLSFKTLTRIKLIADALRNERTLPDVSFLLPTGLKPQFRYIAMHSAEPYRWAWSAFTTAPTFEARSGFWTLPKTDPGPQILISNHEYIPYDADGADQALYTRNDEYNFWEKTPPAYTKEEIDARFDHEDKTESVPPPLLDKINTITPRYPGSTNIFSKLGGLQKWTPTTKNEVNRR